MKWLFVGLTGIMLAVGGLFLTAGASSAKAEKHYRAPFVAESDLAVTGKAEIQVDANDVAHIVIHVQGLIPGERFPTHIHEGASIEEPGPILVALPDLVANEAGVATLVASIPNADTLDLANRTIGTHLSDGTRIAKGAIE
ncbi:MAG: hypothetical protein M5U01_23400 [Ardenticatenaceae bacterium]|nr:hypothetical protein [Ardenticatenaceae bacterium]